MMGLSNRQIKALTVGSVYEIKHARKGKFVAQFMGYDDEAERVGDKEDKVYLKFKYDVRAGTDQVGLAISPKIPVRVSNLKPSLIEEIKLSSEGEWLREVVLPETEEEIVKEPGWLDRLLGRR